MIHLKQVENITTVVLENGKLNVLDTAFLKEIENCFRELSTDDDCHGVVITGMGGSFCAGVDLKYVFYNGKEKLYEFMDALSSCFETLFEFPKPLVGAINGHALAGGCIISSLCDYKIVADGHAKIGITELAVGLPFPKTPLEIMRFILPKKSLQEVFYSAKGYDVSEAQELGLVNEIASKENLIELATLKARQLIRIPAQTFVYTKLHLRRPTILRYQSKSAGEFNEEVKEHWAKEETKQIVENFLESLKK